MKLILKFDSLRQHFICYFHVLCGVNIDVCVFQDLKLLSCLRCDHTLWSPESDLGDKIEGDVELTESAPSFC